MYSAFAIEKCEFRENLRTLVFGQIFTFALIKTPPKNVVFGGSLLPYESFDDFISLILLHSVSDVIQAFLGALSESA